MLAEAEKYKAEDEAEAARIGAKNGLESYAYSLNNSLKEIGDDESKMSKENKTKLQEKIDETIAWLDNSQAATKDEYESQQKELEGVANPIMMEFYQKTGGAPGGFPGAGGPGGPGGFPGAGGPAGGARDD